jgi:hypothetical protein
LAAFVLVIAIANELQRPPDFHSKNINCYGHSSISPACFCGSIHGAFSFSIVQDLLPFKKNAPQSEIDCRALNSLIDIANYSSC